MISKENAMINMIYKENGTVLVKRNATLNHEIFVSSLDGVYSRSTLKVVD